MEILLMGTGNLIPGSMVWSPLSGYKLIFADYNSWSQILLNPDDIDKDVDFIVWVLTLEDILPLRILALQIGFSVHESDKILDKEIEKQLGPLSVFLNSNRKPRIIVAWMFGEHSSAIQRAQSLPMCEKANLVWEHKLRMLQAEHEGLFVLPLYPLFAQQGLRCCLDARNFYSADCRFSSQGLKIIAEGIAQLVNRTEQAAKKVLVLDCDNTLWGGVVGEDGIAGLQLGEDGIGKAFQNFQAVVLALAKQGVLLTILSKNYEEDVWNVFESHHGMRLRREDIVAYRINWEDKVANLQELADELGLGIDSFVFWDDNPLEREKVRNQLPEVFVPEVPKEVWEWEKFIYGLTEFHKFTVTTEDQQKQSQYRARAEFVKDQRNLLNHADFLYSLKLRPSAVSISLSLLARSEQLCAKTNQFNLTNRRHDRKKIEMMSNDPDYTMFLVHLADRYGDHGNVGLVIVRQFPHYQVASLDTFLMSCRVMGRHLESWMLAHCVKLIRKLDVRYLIAEYIPSPRNSMIRGFLESHAFEFVSEPVDINGLSIEKCKAKAESLFYVADLEKTEIPNSEYFNHEYKT